MVSPSGFRLFLS